MQDCAFIDASRPSTSYIIIKGNLPIRDSNIISDNKLYGSPQIQAKSHIQWTKGANNVLLFVEIEVWYPEVGQRQCNMANIAKIIRVPIYKIIFPNLGTEIYLLVKDVSQY